jgi:hypothetical protein
LQVHALREHHCAARRRGDARSAGVITSHSVSKRSTLIAKAASASCASSVSSRTGNRRPYCGAL